MQIDQYLYDLNDSGEAIVAYRMSADNGGSVEICNLSASILSWRVPTKSGEIRDIASGRCMRALRSFEAMQRGSDGDNWGGVRFEEMLWESRVEVNRVVMSLSWESDGVGLMSEVVFDYDDDNTLEITYIACADSPYEIDLTHKLSFSLGEAEEEELQVSINSDRLPQIGTNLYPIGCAKRSILQEVAKIEGSQCSIELLSSQPAIYYDAAERVVSPLTIPTQHVEADERYVQKSLYRVVTE